MRGHLVLWDIDHTLINAGGLSHHLYGVVFAELFGRDLPAVAPMAGRTDRAIIVDTLTRAGIPEPGRHVDAFIRGLTAQAPQFGERVKVTGRVLPGAAEALTAISRLPGPAAPADGAGPARVVQSVLTGNIRPLAEVKLGALGLAARLDLDAGAYGDAHEDRAELVRLARRAAAAAHREDFSGEATVVVGDTPFDVRAALAGRARAVAVATGGSTADELAAAGPHALLRDLSDTERVLAAILGPAAVRPETEAGQGG
ncbi:MAG: haloacid dehalogenase-like hydrolase [Kitasatospora sp.]|nr:haloacid dehalogenase-like hydrolase [Kitasatospora sp.]